MNLDKKLDILPLTKTNPKTLEALFGKKDITPMWVADMEFEMDASIQNTLINRISNSGFGYEYKPKSFIKLKKIGMNAGHWFGREGALFMRMNIATSKEKVQFAIKKIINSVL